jgi:hypothetical protein
MIVLGPKACGPPELHYMMVSHGTSLLNGRSYELHEVMSNFLKDASLGISRIRRCGALALRVPIFFLIQSTTTHLPHTAL